MGQQENMDVLANEFARFEEKQKALENDRVRLKELLAQVNAQVWMLDTTLGNSAAAQRAWQQSTWINNRGSITSPSCSSTSFGCTPVPFELSVCPFPDHPPASFSTSQGKFNRK